MQPAGKSAGNIYIPTVSFFFGVVIFCLAVTYRATTAVTQRSNESQNWCAYTDDWFPAEGMIWFPRNRNTDTVGVQRGGGEVRVP